MNLLFCGRKGTGKSTTISKIEQKLPVKIHRAGEILDKYILSQGEEITYDNRILYSRLLREKTNNGSLYEFSEFNSNKINIFDSLVFIADYKACIKLDSRSKLIGFYTNDNLRFQRIKERGRQDDSNVSSEKIKEMENQGDIEEILSLRDFTIINNSSLLNLETQLEELLKQLNIK